MKAKLEEITLLRGLAIFGIVVLHVTANFITPGSSGLLSYKANLAINQLVRFTLPMFIFISGFGLAYNYDGAPIRLPAYLRKRVAQVLTPYICWSLLYFIFYIMVIGKIPVYDKLVAAGPAAMSARFLVPVFLKNLLFGWNYIHLYFVVLIFQFYLLYPFIIHRLARSARPGLILNAAFVTYLGWMVYVFYFRRLTGNPWFDIMVRYYWGTFVSWYFYFIFGLMAGLHFPRFTGLARQHMTKAALLFVLTSLMLMAESFIYPAFTVPRLISLRPTVLLNFIPAAFFLFALSGRLPELFGLRRFFHTLGRQSMGVYFVHLMVMVLLSRFLLQALPHMFGFARVSYAVILFAGTLFGSMLVVAILGRLPYSSILLGESGRKKVSTATD